VGVGGGGISGVGNGGGISQRSGDLSVGGGGIGGVGDGGGISQGSGDLSVSGGGNDGLGDGGFLVDDGVESVDIISGVLDGAAGAVRLDQGVRSTNDITVAGLVLLLVVSGQGIGNGVSVAALKYSN
jgi:hypothetical protein